MFSLFSRRLSKMFVPEKDTQKVYSYNSKIQIIFFFVGVQNKYNKVIIHEIFSITLILLLWEFIYFFRSWIFGYIFTTFFFFLSIL